ncbi:MAG TPA: FkbM family methyltransferase, partial [Candidatus Marinimicrobia bacterium]|nr:FkbM family methyltransferase [Candidatus Neomarinimicrobiota bacterium]
MRIYSKLKQYYRYRRNWKKFRSRSSKISEDRHITDQLNFYSQLLKRNDLCFDIGANIGDKTSLFLQLGATVVAVEPQESCWQVLKRRFKNNNVYIENCAIANKVGKQTLFVDRSTTLSTMSQDWIATVKQSGRFSGHKWADQISVETTTLDALIDKYGKPVFCKIDVEGCEFEVLKGLSQPINTVSLEFISERIESSLSCVNYLYKLGKTQFNYCMGGSMSFALPNWVDYHE